MISGFLKRCAIAWQVLRGKIRIEGSVMYCNQRHVDGSHEVISRDDLRHLQDNARELVAARAAIAVLEKSPQYTEAIKQSGL